MYTSNLFLAGALAFVAGSHAHVVMNTPVPYGASTVTTSPLSNDNGIDFPCQMGNRADAVEADGASNPMIAGQNNDLKFTGSAVHGGGSCQLSVTYDSPPPADKSKWKVIHSFIGSCPSDTVGNLDQSGTDAYGRPTGKQCTYDTEPDCLKVFQFQIPDGMKNGNATLAWTWFNKVGNREMYMNCAPISISGGSEDDTFFNSLPELFVANVDGSDQSTCKTAVAGGVIGFPDPGDYVTYGEAITPDAQGDCPAASSSNSSSSSDSSSSAVASSYAASTSYAASSSVTPSLTFSAVQAGKTSTAAEAETLTVESTTMLTMTGYATSTAVASSAYATAAATGSYSSSGNSTCTDDKVSCPTPGDLVCVGDSQFGICNIDYCAVPEALSAGTTCSGGVVSKRDVVRRSHRHAAGHLHKRNF